MALAIEPHPVQSVELCRDNPLPERHQHGGGVGSLATGGDWYPDFPEVINAAAAHDWGTTDLFPTFTMPSLQ